MGGGKASSHVAHFAEAHLALRSWQQVERSWSALQGSQPLRGWCLSASRLPPAQHTQG